MAGHVNRASSAPEACCDAALAAEPAVACGSAEEEKPDFEGEKRDVGETALFSPPLWRQRRLLAAGILRDRDVVSVLDIGCGEGSHLAFLIPCGGAGPSVCRLAGVDIDPEEIKRASEACKPWEADFTHLRHSPLVVELYEGSVAVADDRLRGFDAAICIEVIEHLDPPVLAALPKTLFGDYRPKVVVISTPNVEFNVHFDGLKLTPRGTYMRHDDHRFEWTRAQFEEWCTGVADQYRYAVRFTGVGVVGEYDPETGYCTQVCVFDRLEDTLIPQPLERPGLPFEPYRLAASYEFPWYSAQDASPAETLSVVKSFVPYTCTELTPETLVDYAKLPPLILELATSGRKLHLSTLESLWCSLQVRQRTRCRQKLRELLENEVDSFTFVLPPEQGSCGYRVPEPGERLTPKQFDAVLIVVHPREELESFVPHIPPDPDEEVMEAEEETPPSDEDDEWGRSVVPLAHEADDEEEWEAGWEPPDSAEKYVLWDDSSRLCKAEAAVGAFAWDEMSGWGVHRDDGKDPWATSLDESGHQT